MADPRAQRRRIAFAVALASLLVVVGYAILSFIAVAVLSVFLYYAIRPIHRFLERFRLGRRLRALLSIFLFGLPLLGLLVYTVVIVALEIRAFLDREAADNLLAQLDIAGLEFADLEALVTGNQTGISSELIIDSFVAFTTLAGAVFVQLILIITATYYMLVDGPRFVSWALDTYDESGIARRYVQAVDPELSLALFGNIVNVFITAIIGITTFYTFNAFVPATIQIPFAGLLGALAGIGSLIPVIGIKLVYVPLTIGLAVNASLMGEPGLVLPVAVLFVVSVVIVDFIPDFFIRAKVSSTATHTGLLLIAYIVGPSVFGFYGLFLAPIVLILTTNAVTVLLPYVVSGPTLESRQTKLSAYADSSESSVESETTRSE